MKNHIKLHKTYPSINTPSPFYSIAVFPLNKQNSNLLIEMWCFYFLSVLILKDTPGMCCCKKPPWAWDWSQTKLRSSPISALCWCCFPGHVTYPLGTFCLRILLFPPFKEGIIAGLWGSESTHMAHKMKVSKHSSDNLLPLLFILA